MSTLAAEMLRDNEARFRRTKRETIQAQIDTSVNTLGKIAREISEKEALLDQLRKLETAVTKLPLQIVAKRGQLASGGFQSASIPCLRTELLASVAGGIGFQEMKLSALVERREAEERTLAQMRRGILEFSEPSA